MPFISRWSMGYSTTLAAAVADTTGTAVSVTSAAGLPSLTVPTGAVPAVTAILVGNEIMYVTAISGTTLTVQRGQEGSTATTHASGATVSGIVSRDTLYNNSAPGAILATIPTGTSTYVPDLTYKYHHLTLGGSTTLTIAAPAASTLPVQAGDELRFTFQITATALSTQPAWHACYRRYNQGTATQGTVTLTANTLTGFSFFYTTGGIAATAAWVRQH